MYNDIEVQKQVFDVIKKGENKLDKTACYTHDLTKDVIDYFNQCQKASVPPISKFFKNIKDNCFAVKNYNLFSYSQAIGKILGQT